MCEMKLIIIQLTGINCLKKIKLIQWNGCYNVIFKDTTGEHYMKVRIEHLKKMLCICLTCTWYHVRQNFVETLQAVAASEALVIRNVHPVDLGAMSHSVHAHIWWILNALKVSLQAFPHISTASVKTSVISMLNVKEPLLR